MLHSPLFFCTKLSAFILPVRSKPPPECRTFRYVERYDKNLYFFLKDNPVVPIVPVVATAKKPGKKSNRPTGDKTMRIPNELVPLMQTAIDRLYNNPASGSVDLNEIQKFIDEAGKLL